MIDKKCKQQFFTNQKNQHCKSKHLNKGPAIPQIGTSTITIVLALNNSDINDMCEHNMYKERKIT